MEKRKIGGHVITRVRQVDECELDGMFERGTGEEAAGDEGMRALPAR